MGNDTPTGRRNYDPDFKMQNYVNRGLRQPQILKVKDAFDAFNPENGYIDAQKFRQSTSNSGDKDQISRLIGTKQKLDFDDFFNISIRLIEQKIRKNPNITIDLDSNEVQATCLFCPYTEDRKR